MLALVTFPVREEVYVVRYIERIVYQRELLVLTIGTTFHDGLATYQKRRLVKSSRLVHRPSGCNGAKTIRNRLEDANEIIRHQQ
jgi:hypothetical protein